MKPYQLLCHAILHTFCIFNSYYSHLSTLYSTLKNNSNHVNKNCVWF